MISREGKSTEQHADELLAKILKGMESGVKRMEADSKMLVGVDTGDLRRSLTSSVQMNGENIVGTVGSNLDYAFFHALQNPYLTTAVDQNLEFLKQAIKSEVG